MMAKRVFGKMPKAGSTFRVKHDAQNCYELQWFIQRYPLNVSHRKELQAAADRYREKILFLEQIIDRNYEPQEFELSVPARDYQKKAAELWLKTFNLLLADEVGLGKTASAIAAMATGDVLPVVVATLAHLPTQWKREIERFAPKLFVHVLKKGTPYELPTRDGRKPDVLISSYHKLSGWCDVLAEYCRGVVWDEVQELRHSDTQKYRGAGIISKGVSHRIGLSATPIYNFGAEMFNVMEQIAPGALGTREEFDREWCSGKSIKNPDAFGAYLKSEFLMLRRTRSEVGRELPALQKITIPVDSDEDAMKAVEGRAGELARMILEGVDLQRGEAMQAAGEFDALMRQATGIAKAPHVATFVELLLEQGKPVVLFGWHHAVYEIWMKQLARFNPRLYSGHQSATQKQEAVDAFIAGESDALIISLRAGAGLDGLQKRCATTVHGELDWSPGIIEQNIGRVARDGQTEPVVSFILLSDTGSDPLMAETIGLKTDQIEGIRGRSNVLQRKDNGQTLKRLAAEYLKRVDMKRPEQDEE